MPNACLAMRGGARTRSLGRERGEGARQRVREQTASYIGGTNRPTHGSINVEKKYPLTRNLVDTPIGVGV